MRFAENYRGPILVDHVMCYAPIVAKAKELLTSWTIGVGSEKFKGRYDNTDIFKNIISVMTHPEKDCIDSLTTPPCADIRLELRVKAVTSPCD